VYKIKKNSTGFVIKGTIGLSFKRMSSAQFVVHSEQNSLLLKNFAKTKSSIDSQESVGQESSLRPNQFGEPLYRKESKQLTAVTAQQHRYYYYTILKLLYFYIFIGVSSYRFITPIAAEVDYFS